MSAGLAVAGFLAVVDGAVTLELEMVTEVTVVGPVFLTGPVVQPVVLSVLAIVGTVPDALPLGSPELESCPSAERT